MDGSFGVLGSGAAQNVLAEWVSQCINGISAFRKAHERGSKSAE